MYQNIIFPVVNASQDTSSHYIMQEPSLRTKKMPCKIIAAISENRSLGFKEKCFKTFNYSTPCQSKKEHGILVIYRAIHLLGIQHCDNVVSTKMLCQDLICFGDIAS